MCVVLSSSPAVAHVSRRVSNSESKQSFLDTECGTRLPICFAVVLALHAAQPAAVNDNSSQQYCILNGCVNIACAPAPQLKCQKQPGVRIVSFRQPRSRLLCTSSFSPCRCALLLLLLPLSFACFHLIIRLCAIRR